MGRNSHNYQIGPLAEIVVRALPKPVTIDWHGDPDRRSYRVSFDRIEFLGYRAQCGAEEGARAVFEALECGKTAKTARTITLEWYKTLLEWHRIIKEVEMYGGILDV